MDSVKTGAHTHLSFVHEDNGFLADPSDSDNKPFGYDAVVTDFSGDNNPEDLYEPNQRNVSQIIAQGFEGSVSVEGTLTNPWWFQEVIAPPSSTDGSHTYGGQWPDSMQITVGFPGESTGYLLKGVGVESGTITVEANGLVTFTLDCLYADEEEIGSVPDQPSLELEPFAAQHASVELDSTTLELIDSAEIEIQNTLELVHEIGTRNAVGISVRERVPTLNFSQYRVAGDNRQRMYGSEGSSSVQTSVDDDYDLSLIADDGSSNTLTIGMNGSFPETAATENAGDPQEDIMESVDWRSTAVEATADNSVSTAR